MDESTGKEFNPCRFLTDAAAVFTKRASCIEFKAGFDERKKARAKSNLEVAMKDTPQERLHGSDEVRDRDLTINHQALHLVKGVVVAGVGGFMSEAFSRRDHSKRRLKGFHSSNL